MRWPRQLLVAGLAATLVGVVSARDESPAIAAQTNSWSAVLGAGQSNASAASDSCGALGTLSAVNNSYANPLRTLRNGADIFVVGCFKNWAGLAAADYVAKWDGTSWSALGDDGSGDGAIKGAVYDATVYKGNLVIAGNFSDAGGTATADAIASWNGSSWDGFGIGSSGGCPCSAVSANGDYATALEVDGKGTVSTTDDELLIGGNFYYGANDGTAPTGYPLGNTTNFFKWTGTTFAAVDSDSNPWGTNTYTKAFLPMDIAFVGSTLYVGSYHLPPSSFSSYSSYKNTALQKLGADWTSAGIGGAAAPSGEGWGVTRLNVSDSKLYVGGSFADAGGVASADFLAILDPAGPTWSNMHGASPSFTTNWSVNAIEVAGSQIVVSAPGGSFGTQRWTGTEWVTLTSTTASSLLFDENYSGSSDRLLLGAILPDLAGISAADYFASLALTSTSTLDTASSSNSSPALVFDGSTSYTLNLPANKCSETISLTTSDSGAAYTGATTASPAPGGSTALSIKVVSSDATSSTTYTFTVARAGTATKPTTDTTSASSITSNSASVSASFNPNGQSGSYYFEYSTNADMSGSSQTSTTSAACTSDSATVSASLWSLSGGTTYYVRLVGTNATGTQTGAISSFTTSAPIPTATAATSIGTTTATLNGTVNPSGSSTSYYFEYGTSLSFGSKTSEPAWVGQQCFGASAGSGGSAIAKSASVIGLTPNTLYYFRLVACWSVGWPTVVKQSSALTFTTSSVTTSTEAPSTSASSSPPASDTSTPTQSSVESSTSTSSPTQTESGTTTSAVPAATTTAVSVTTVAVSVTATIPAPTTTAAKALTAPSAVSSTLGKTLSVKVSIATETKSVTAAGLPTGTKFNAKTGTISGKPLKKGTYSVTVSGVLSGKRVTIKVKITVK